MCLDTTTSGCEMQVAVVVSKCGQGELEDRCFLTPPGKKSGEFWVREKGFSQGFSPGSWDLLRARDILKTSNRLWVFVLFLRM
jgi:hypothetical protein